MNRFLIFFRAINVGGNNILPMKALKSVLSDAGYGNIISYIQSGNVILDSTKKNSKTVSSNIATLVDKEFGFLPAVWVLEAEDFHAAINNCPYKTDDGKTLHYYFMASNPKDPDLALCDKLKVESEQYRVVDKVFYLLAPEGVGRSKLAAKVEKCMGVPVTARNWNTVKKMSNLLEEQ